MAMLRTYLARLRAVQGNARLFLLSNAILNVATGALSLLYGIFLTRLGYTTDFLSVLLVVGIVGAGVGLIPALLIADRYSIRALLIWSNIIGGVAVAGQIIIPQPAVLITTTFIAGASVSIYIVLTPPLLAATSSEVERTHLFALNATVGSLTIVAGSLLGGFLPGILGSPLVLHSFIVAPLRHVLVSGSALPLQLALLVGGLLAVPSLWPLARMDDAVARPRSQATSARAAVDWRAWLREHVHPSALGQQARQLVAWRGIRFTAYEGILGLGAGLFLTYLNLYFVNHLHVATATFGVISSVSTIVLAAATLGAPILAERLGGVRGPVSAQLLSVPLLVGLAFITNVPVVAVFYLLRGTLMNLGSPALQSFMMSMLPSRERGAANSAFNVAFQVTSAVGGVASGFIIARLGYGVDYILAAICYLSAMLLLTPWFGQERRLLGAAHASEDHAEVPPHALQPLTANEAGG
jgi:MFS family permease